MSWFNVLRSSAPDICSIKLNSMNTQITGLHHITAIAGNARRNYDFYTQVLGLRMVKKTVNFDDPGTYHFYFGNASNLTFNVSAYAAVKELWDMIQKTDTATLSIKQK